jgi:hypothetical protein
VGISCGLEVVPAFIGIEEIADVADGAPEIAEGAGLEAPEVGL